MDHGDIPPGDFSPIGLPGGDYPGGGIGLPPTDFSELGAIDRQSGNPSRLSRASSAPPPVVQEVGPLTRTSSDPFTQERMDALMARYEGPADEAGIVAPEMAAVHRRRREINAIKKQFELREVDPGVRAVLSDLPESRWRQSVFDFVKTEAGISETKEKLQHIEDICKSWHTWPADEAMLQKLQDIRDLTLEEIRQEHAASIQEEERKFLSEMIIKEEEKNKESEIRKRGTHTGLGGTFSNVAQKEMDTYMEQVKGEIDALPLEDLRLRFGIASAWGRNISIRGTMINMIARKAGAEATKGTIDPFKTNPPICVNGNGENPYLMINPELEEAIFGQELTYLDDTGERHRMSTIEYGGDDSAGF